MNVHHHTTNLDDRLAYDYLTNRDHHALDMDHRLDVHYPAHFRALRRPSEDDGGDDGQSHDRAPDYLWLRCP